MKITIRTKLAAPITLLIGFIALFIVVYFPSALERQEIEAVASKARSIANMTAFSASAGVFFSDIRAIEDAFEVARQNPDLAYVVITDRAGDVVAAHNRPTELSALAAPIGGRVSTDGLRYRVESPVLVENERIGTLYLGLSLEEVHERIADMRRAVAWLALLLFLAGMATVFALSAFITKPLRHITARVEAVAAGDLSKRAAVSSGDEVEDLAHAFNRMIEKLERAYTELETLNVDLQDQKEALREAHDELEARVRLRTAALEDANRELKEEVAERKRTQEQLRIAKEVAESATRAKSEFLDTMSHEIRTPLNGVIGMTTLLLETGLDEHQRSFAEVIQSSGESLSSLLNDILDFSKIEAGQLELEAAPFSLREIVEKAIDPVAIKGSSKGLEIGYTMEPEVPELVVGDATRVQQILVNLLGNAVKFTDRGEVFLSVQVERQDDREIKLRFSVRDTGIGIPEDRMDRLFQSFSQIDSSTTRRYGGTGLGLAISKRLSEAMGGSVWAESRAGRGSVFHFTIRVTTTPSSAPWYGAGAETFAGERVLVLVENGTLRRALVDLLRAWGLEPTPSATLEEARGLARGSPYDIAIADVNALEPEVESASEALRAACERVVLLSDFGKQGAWDLGATKAPGRLLVLNKPIKYSRLRSMLGELCATRPPGRERRARLSLVVDHETTERVTLLLAEDNPVNRDVATHMLRRLGYEVDHARDGEEVLEAVSKRSYPLVLMDLRMPEMDGFEATRRIMADIPAEERPIIVAMTADVTREKQRQCREAGMAAFLPKPIEMARLADVLNTHLTKTPRGQATRPAREPKGRSLVVDKVD